MPADVKAQNRLAMMRVIMLGATPRAKQTSAPTTRETARMVRFAGGYFAPSQP